MESLHRKLIILGSGPAGYTAAIYTGRMNMKPSLITGSQLGGQLTSTHTIENWPGDPSPVSGFDLMERMKKQAEEYSTELINDHIVQTNLNTKPFELDSESTHYTCDALIIATGASAKYLGLPSEQKYLGHGVSGCATCDGFFYRNKRVAVIGGGNTAIEDALYLSNIAEHVTVIHRRDSFNAEPVLVKQLMKKAEDNLVTIEWNNETDEILGDENVVTGIRIKDKNSGATKEVAVSGIFVAIGRKPNTEIFADQLTMDHGYLVVKKDTHGAVTATNIPGVFAAGDVADPFYRQAIVAAGTGCRAALDVQRFFERG
ncbi:MAG: thioredoxin-disulfide reductase [Pseudomonadota bacterium]|nr:thioredoxin-disulfide reductase [Gammaproteobacteria bacterium]